MARPPVRVRKKANVAAKAPREPLCYLPDPTDPDKEITVDVPVKIPPNFMWQYMKDLRTMANEKAIARMMERLLGRKGIDALAACEDVDDDEMAEILRIIEEKTTAAMEAFAPGN